MRLGSFPGAVALALATHGVSQSINPNLDLSGLGQVALTGDFDAISVYSFPGQFNRNGSNSILQHLPDGAYEILAATDATINTMCPFVRRDGTFEGVIVGGNFTSLGGVASRSIALYNPDSREITPLVGLEGAVAAVLCDAERETVYVAGSFDAANSSNAIAWTVDGAWQTLPFAGFDAPVESVTKAPNGHIIFAGQFTGLGNTSTTSTARDRATQEIPLSTSNITVGGASTQNADAIACASNGSSVAWKLNNDTPGFWRADFGFGFEPTRLRLYNAGTKEFRFTAFPINGIMNLTYTDPDSGDERVCDARCPLPENPEDGFVDFFFVNAVGMNNFRIDISDWYGDAGGFAGIELFQSDIFSYAVSDFNEPSCGDPSATLSSVTTTGPWFEMASFDSVSRYLAAVPGPDEIDTTEITFEPNVQERGNYTVTIYTPGCIQDSSCSSRATVNITGTLTSDSDQTFFTQIAQTNNFDKYDNVYQGPIDVASGDFRPRISIKASGQLGTQRIVASRVKFGLIASTGGLNGIFDFDPDQASVNPNDFSDSDINNAGTLLNSDAVILSLLTVDSAVFAGGSFQDDRFENIMQFTSEGNASSLADGGLNAAAMSMYALDGTLYVGGNFTGTSDGNQQGLSSVAAYSIADSAWIALGAGLNGPVAYVVPIPMNISDSETETCISFGGSFTQIRESGSEAAIEVDGMAVWVPSAKNWIQRSNAPQQVVNGQLTAGVFLPNNSWVGAGSLSTLGQALHGVADMHSHDGQVALSSLPLNIQPAEQNSALRKRAILGTQNITGVLEAITYDPSGDNVTVFGGRFTADADGTTIQNLLFLNGSNNNALTGLPEGIDENSTFIALQAHRNLLFAGGLVSGEAGDRSVSGVLLYDMDTADFASIQPAGLVGSRVIVNDIKTQPDADFVYVAGAFERTTQGLSCPCVCMYDTNTNQWNTVGSGLSGTVAQLFWDDNDKLLAVGNLTLAGNNTSLVQYDPDDQVWTQIIDDSIPGPISALTVVTEDGKEMWVAGTANNGSTFLIGINDGENHIVPEMFSTGTTIYSLEVVDAERNNDNNDFLSRDENLLVMGQLNITGFGPASAAVFNGSDIIPLILASKADGTPGSISQLAASNPRTLRSEGKSLPLVTPARPLTCHR